MTTHLYLIDSEEYRRGVLYSKEIDLSNVYKVGEINIPEVMELLIVYHPGIKELLYTRGNNYLYCGDIGFLNMIEWHRIVMGAAFTGGCYRCIFNYAEAKAEQFKKALVAYEVENFQLS